MNRHLSICFLLLFCVLFSACKAQEASSPSKEPNLAGGKRNHAMTPYQSSPALPASYAKEAVLIAVGDIMMHMPLTRSGYDPRTKEYRFDGFFTEVKEILSGGDWVFGNLETPLAGKEAGFSGYPRFNAPDELADALKNAGFTIVQTANNHALDRGEQGILRTLENLRSRGLCPVGTAASSDEAEQILIIEKKGISMAFLAYTYGTNGIPLPQGKAYLVSLIDEERIKKEIARARSGGADWITVALHFGQEYQRYPNEEQKRLAKALIGAGADIILGSHPHVVQPYQFVETEDGRGGKRKGVVIYSLGNFLSNQRDPYTDLGVIFKITVRKHFPEGRAEIAGVDAIPTWVHRYRDGRQWKYRVLPLNRIEEYQKDVLLTPREKEALAHFSDLMLEHLQSMAVPVHAEEP